MPIVPIIDMQKIIYLEMISGLAGNPMLQKNLFSMSLGGLNHKKLLIKHSKYVVNLLCIS
ncbi:hypothetical protein A7978_04295 [Borrelia turicatae]|uniref:Uncharacterized protein n=1 Tax=Borrelia turicatae TaxID=142 RepID=A0A172XCK8_BORTU|nr:hypothetical protein A7978_04295 [Borrelia turicatae]